MSTEPLPDHDDARVVSGPPAEASGDDLLVIDDLRVTVHDGARTAVRGASVRVGRAEIVGLVGESGSGKTLTCRAALGLLPAGCEVSSGAVSFAGRPLVDLSRRDWEAVHGQRIGAVFQDPASYLNPSITVGRQLSEVLRIKLGLSRRAARARAIDLFTEVGLHAPERVWSQLPVELSGGMLQRVLIAIALSCNPELLIADEATTALDVTIQAEIIDLLRRERDERGLSVLFVSHDLAVISELCDRVVVFYAGEVVESGPAEEILSRPRHPYTQALLRVASVGDYKRRKLETILGQPPEVGAEITGCRFASRCPFAHDDCRRDAIAPRSIAAGHEVRCRRVDDAELVGQLVHA